MPTGKGLRWWIFALLLAANLVNNLDRQVFALVAPQLQHEMAWREVDYARMIAAFQFTFALMNLGLGRIIDRFGTRASMIAAILLFSLAQFAHALVRGPAGFLAARIGLAIGEAPVYPATLKALAEWAPRSERGSAAGFVHFGVMLGALFAPILIPALTAFYGWKAGFVATGLLGLVVLLPICLLFRKPEDQPRLSPYERALILDSRTNAATTGGIAWLTLFRRREMWVYVAIQAIVNPAWWFLTYWLPKFLGEVFGIKGLAVTPYLSVVFAMASVGALAGGALSGILLKHGLSVNAARKFTMLLCGLVMPTVVVATQTSSPLLAVVVIGVGAVVHQTWTATGAAVLADLFPPRAIATVAGIGSFFGSLAGVLAAEATGRLLDIRPGFYTPMFVYAGLAYLLALAAVHLLSPKLRPVDQL